MADDVTVTIDMRPARAEGTAFFKAFEHNLAVEFERVLLAALKVAQAYAPKGDHNYVIDWSDGAAIHKVAGGTLRRSLTHALEEGLDTLIGRIGVSTDSPAAKYARIAELGGTITPKRGPFLVFSPDGQTIVRARVVHREAHPYILPALAYAWPLVKRIPEVAFTRTKAEMGLAA